MNETSKRVARLVAGLGALSLVGGIALGYRACVLAALASAWLFFAGISAGSVALGAAIRVAQGRWARGVLPLADAGAGFFLPSLVILAILVLGAPMWMPESAHGSFGASLAPAARDLLGGLALYAAGRRLLAAARARRPEQAWAVIYLLLYAVVLSLWAVDLVMSLHEWAPSTAIPAYYFMGCLVSGLAWVTLVGCFRGETVVDSDTRHDLGKLLFGMTTFLAYLLWSIYLPTWYANLPDETGQLLARWEGHYRLLSKGVLLFAFLLPFVLLMTERAKRRRDLLGVGAVSILGGLFTERFLLVLPSLQLSLGGPSILLAAGTVAGVGGLFVSSFFSEWARHPSASPVQAGDAIVSR